MSQLQVLRSRWANWVLVISQWAAIEGTGVQHVTGIKADVKSSSALIFHFLWSWRTHQMSVWNCCRRCVIIMQWQVLKRLNGINNLQKDERMLETVNDWCLSLWELHKHCENDWNCNNHWLRFHGAHWIKRLNNNFLHDQLNTWKFCQNDSQKSLRSRKMPGNTLYRLHGTTYNGM